VLSLPKPDEESAKMTLSEFLTALAQLSGLLFIVTSMLAMGMSLSMAEILQPLKNVRLVVLALLGNFVLVPLLAAGRLQRQAACPVRAARRNCAQQFKVLLIQ
jgi:hypothetical protein